MLVIIKGAGDLASGVALRLRHAGFDIAMTEIERPLAVRRTICFSQAVYEGSCRVEDLTALLVKDETGMRDCFFRGRIAVFVDPGASIVDRFSPDVLVDAIMAKRNTGTSLRAAPVVIALGPGFTAGIDCHAVIETMRGHTLGRVITAGSALPNTGVPGDIGGHTIERLLRSPAEGVFEGRARIGDTVRSGDTVASVNGIPIRAEIDGVLRGLLPSGLLVSKGMKAGDIDPRCEVSHCFTVSDKALSIAGGVLEAILRFRSCAGSGYDRIPACVAEFQPHF
ncbi:MAG: EF2563 family selenium-dependent molybdenum hydroxylase system protein [Spirochaetaceae bacterium]|jgi:xanthine dehydrogenase accessory factor|nr:EF2563 family selenium-dependent molybdenum hydroxylase system protein [Spirochaetaceae bacterium]